LLDRNWAGAVEMPTQVLAQPSQIKFLPSSDSDRVITRGNHAFELFVLGKLAKPPTGM
jgi:hypothetical protein